MEGEERELGPHPHITEIASFLIATATAMRDTVARLERTTAHVSEYVTSRPGLVDRGFIVQLQDFDRLQQEFAGFADVLSLAAAKSVDSWLRAEGGGHPAEDAIATISVADLKERLMRILYGSMFDLGVKPTGNEVEF